MYLKLFDDFAKRFVYYPSLFYIRVKTYCTFLKKESLHYLHTPPDGDGKGEKDEDVRKDCDDTGTATVLLDIVLLNIILLDIILLDIDIVLLNIILLDIILLNIILLNIL